jgi:LAO/AO transport system kinase
MLNANHKKEWLKSRKSRAVNDVDVLVKGILSGDMNMLSRALTLVESTKISERKLAEELVFKLIPYTGKAIRIGVTGVPGVGKSTFIEAFGLDVLKEGKKIAVLAIDPSSERSKGSILGDKTRMNQLSVAENAFIRPTASSGSLGGVARRTRESILLCEAFGFDLILVETVGVGQSETMVKELVDFFLLLMLAGAGDELQGIKRGIMEMADALVITKADGDNENSAKVARRSYQNAMHLFQAQESNWIPKALLSSAYENKGIHEVWQMIESFQLLTTRNGFLEKNRKEQEIYWFNESLKHLLIEHFYQFPEIDSLLKLGQEAIHSKKSNAFVEAQKIVNYYHQQLKNEQKNE